MVKIKGNSMDLLRCKWASVDNFPGYFISPDGDVMSLNYAHLGINKILKPFMRGISPKYKCVKLTKERKEKTISLHRLIAKTYIYQPEGKDEVNHIDGNTFNNDIRNLEWCTHRENCLHSKRILRKYIGEEIHSTKINLQTAKEIKFLISNNYKNKFIADKLSVSRNIVADIRRGRNWKYA
jgi:hypothetical protein